MSARRKEEAVEQIHDRVAGLDVHRDSVAVCVRVTGPRGGAGVEKERFATTTAALARLREWLADRQVSLVVMEATGVYWKPVFFALEDSFEVWLCNAQHVKNVPGRKTCPMPSGSLTWRRMAWSARVSYHRWRFASCAT